MIWKIKPLLTGVNEKEKNTVLFACEELKKYFSIVTTEDVLISETSVLCEEGLVLGIGLHDALAKVEDPVVDDAIVIDIQGRNGIITGNNARSVLIAAYRYLRELGYTFIRPGKDGELYPKELIAKDIYINETPSYRMRTICIEGSVSYESMVDMVDWIPKVSMNGYYTQFFIPMIFYKRWYEHRGYGMVNPYLEMQHLTEEDVAGMTQMLEREAEKRSLLYNGIGHGWTCAPFDMPALGWERVEESRIPKGIEKYCAMLNGKRQLYCGVPMNTQLCYGNPEVHQKIVDYTVEYCKKNTNMNYVAFILADGANMHCECELCRDTRPSDFYVSIMNDIDKRLSAENISTKFLFSIYTDMLWPPVKEKLHNKDRFVLKFCPISRSYTKALTLESDLEMGEFVRNKLKFPTTVEQYAAHLRAWKEAFDGESFAFDYYYMWDCYKDLGATETARVIHQDIRNYKNMKINGLISCQGQRVFSPTSLGMNMIARTLWNRECDFDVERDDVLKSEYGQDFALVRDYLQDLSIFSLPEVARMEKPLVSEENVASYKAGLERAKTFVPIIEEHLKSAVGCERTSWKYLQFHTELSIMVMTALQKMANGAEHDGLWEPIEDFVNQKEWEMRSYFDAFEFKYTYTRIFPKLKDAQKSLVLGM